MVYLVPIYQENPLVESKERGKKNKGNKHTRQKWFYGSKKYKLQSWIVLCLIMFCIISRPGQSQGLLYKQLRH